MGAVHRMATYLGLGEVDSYDEHYEYEDDDAPASERAARRWATEEEAPGIVMIHPRRYSDAPTIGKHFREGRSVIMDVSEMATADATRMVDFAAGLIYGCEGRIERIADRVFLLAPDNVEVSID